MTAYVATAPELPATGWQVLQVRDRFGVLSQCDVQQLRALPRTESGAVDRALLTGGSASGERKVPRTQVEQQIARIWQDVLGLPQVGLQDNFFELGGHSLLLVQAQSRLQELFGSPLSVVDMFTYPTIEALARYLTQEQADDQAVGQGLERASVRAAQRAASGGTDVAVIGMSCRFPGAETIEAFWRNLRDGVESITVYTDTELLAAGIDPVALSHPHDVKASPSLASADLANEETWLRFSLDEVRLYQEPDRSGL